jgi:hypothetical protein
VADLVRGDGHGRDGWSTCHHLRQRQRPVARIEMVRQVALDDLDRRDRLLAWNVAEPGALTKDLGDLGAIEDRGCSGHGFQRAYVERM